MWSSGQVPAALHQLLIDKESQSLFMVHFPRPPTHPPTHQPAPNLFLVYGGLVMDLWQDPSWEPQLP